MLDVGALSAGPLPPIGNLLLHLIYGFTLGQLYDASADAPAVGDDLVYDEPLERDAVEHSEDFGAAGILAGAIVGAAVGVGMAIVLPPTLPNVDFGGWEIALAVGGILAGGAVGGIVGSFAGLPHDADRSGRACRGRWIRSTTRCCRSCCRRSCCSWSAAIVVTMGTGLLQLGKTMIQIGPIEIAQAVVAAIIGIFAIGFGALLALDARRISRRRLRAATPSPTPTTEVDWRPRTRADGWRFDHELGLPQALAFGAHAHQAIDGEARATIRMATTISSGQWVAAIQITVSRVWRVDQQQDGEPDLEGDQRDRHGPERALCDSMGVLHAVYQSARASSARSLSSGKPLMRRVLLAALLAVICWPARRPPLPSPGSLRPLRTAPRSSASSSGSPWSWRRSSSSWSKAC